MDYFNIMEKHCLDLGLNFDLEKYNKFKKYMDLLQTWNKKINLTSIKENEQIVKKHFIDSINAFQFLPLRNSSSIIDIGTGAGFPGIPISIMKPDIKIVLLDSLSKRVNFLNEVIESIDLKNTSAIHSRAEDAARRNEYRECFDISISRAVGNLSVLSELCIPFVKLNGYFIAMKGPAVSDEIEESKNAISILGGKIEDIIKVRDNELNHNLVIIKKVKNTPSKYPRRAGIVSKKPLK
ncbi:16S rRNA (guanine(527)-N(7))-methyltransferase RsmG [Clostridium sp.]|jgi:16S rRNA (guanine527-N7)-methyltransferase|uniref:16S rRNA (guanine(527)-N(7))-methyltransferase RsmG n=1 Tax=Clostridium sp. TaxID=1506 RepID=UPI003A5BF2E6